ncbi:adenylate cyclase [Tistlia consotensis]|uniref:Adenylate cyclase n=1 Tax=Tistlia consotensis USBA 355 TaxID=560819 RepID=A0A1Y6CPE3_9PROT|nr:adenylate/guanylate cyclase domain-containing protein [Tistlia consotensis]SMF63882.1 adenylate cyclase [Tistlia consotensis USBA 355]SNR98308.1 adenylate cyclase [Tistlia consotensis]
MTDLLDIQQKLTEPAKQDLRKVLFWLYEEAGPLLSRPSFFFGAFCQKLRDIGIPIERASLHVRQLHPQFAARTLLWHADAGGAVEQDRRHGVSNEPAFQQSPVKPIYEGSPALRRRLSGPEARFDFPVLGDLARDGYTDYTIRPVRYSAKHPMAISLATKEPQGFSDANLATLDALLRPFGSLLELAETKRTTRLLLDTYLGPQAGRQVLQGDIIRGQGQHIDAVVWMSDLRNFTELSNRLPLDQVIAMLDGYFDAMCGPVREYDGEILKFIGDSVLAVFPVPAGQEGCPYASRRALQAAEAAIDGLERLNGEFEKQGLPRLRTGIAMHSGEVMYGNVGAADRLDFTVIGPAVNLVSRLGPLARDLEPPIVLSATCARFVDRPLRRLGAFALKGFDETQEAYALLRPAAQAAE